MNAEKMFTAVDQPQRTKLPHDAPDWVEARSVFFLTICARDRGKQTLTERNRAEKIIRAARHYHEIEHWHLHLFLVMPDHLHMLLSFPEEQTFRKLIFSWKSFTARTGGFLWQRDFFDHRLRSDESFEEKATYIRMNPVRAGLVGQLGEWPHVWDPRASEDQQS